MKQYFLCLIIISSSFGLNERFCPLANLHTICSSRPNGPKFMLAANCDPFNPADPQCSLRLPNDPFRTCHFCCNEEEDNDSFQKCSDLRYGYPLV